MANGADEPPRLSPWGTFWLIAGAAALIYLCWARTTNNGLTVDGTTLLYIAVAVFLLILPAIVPLVKSVTVGKDSITVTLDRLEKEVRNVRQITDENAKILRSVAPNFRADDTPLPPVSS